MVTSVVAMDGDEIVVMDSQPLNHASSQCHVHQLSFTASNSLHNTQSIAGELACIRMIAVSEQERGLIQGDGTADTFPPAFSVSCLLAYTVLS